MIRRRLTPLSLVALAVLLIAGGSAVADVQRPASGPSTPGPNGIIDVEHLMEDPDCDLAQLTGPEAAGTAHLTGAAPKIKLDVLVLVDNAKNAAIAGMRSPRARAAAQKALFKEVRDSLMVGVESYRPLGVDLKYDDFALLQPFVDGAPRERTDDAREIIALAKEQLGGERRKDVDVVYIVTDVDIQVPGIGKGVAGLADCIGGVALPDRAFAVGERNVGGDDGSVSFGPVTFYKDLAAKIAAHEIGHLMGGHHHYQECGTPAAVAVGRGETGPCTIMTNFVDFQTLPFSRLNGVVVRGHAEMWARQTDR